MGMDLKVTLPGGGGVPAWPAVLAQLHGSGEPPVEMRMIDGELALPDEEPPTEGWRELRVASGGAMVTIRRSGPSEVTLVAWGNADEAQRRLWQRLAQAFAEAGGGQVQQQE